MGFTCEYPPPAAPPAIYIAELFTAVQCHSFSMKKQYEMMTKHTGWIKSTFPIIQSKICLHYHHICTYGCVLCQC